MRVDFYQLSRDPAEAAVALIARKSLEAGKRLLIVADGADRLSRISEALWSVSGTFLANGRAGGAHDARQLILLAGDLPDAEGAANGATFLALADGQWREPAGFERTFLFFDDGTLAAAREVWRMLGSREGTERHFWKQDGGSWVKAG